MYAGMDGACKAWDGTSESGIDVACKGWDGGSSDETDDTVVLTSDENESHATAVE